MSYGVEAIVWQPERNRGRVRYYRLTIPGVPGHPAYREDEIREAVSRG